MQFTFEQIEDLKRQYTDKYVLVDSGRPELRRFHGETGRIKTVNMNGRALVQFDVANNIAWFDIGLDFLRVVDGPQVKPAEPEKAGHDRASAPAKVKVDSPAATAGGAKVPPPGPAKQSTADILAAARAAKSEAAKAPAAKPPAAKPPAAKPPAGGKAPAAGGKLSTAAILAAARAAKEHPSEEQPAPVAEASAAEAEVEELEAEAAAEVPKAAPPAKVSAPSASGPLPKNTADIISWCRQRDAK